MVLKRAKQALERDKAWSMWKDVLATFFGALGAIATVAGPVLWFTFDWMRSRDRTEAQVLIRVEQLEKNSAAGEVRVDRDRRELTERLARIEGILLARPVK